MEHKFRAWDKENKCMVYQEDMNGYMINKPYWFSLSKCEVELLKFDEDYKAYCRINADVMEYTGLKDINGIEIYEGDIIPFHFNENVKGIVKFGEYKNPCDDKFSKHQGFYVEFINRDSLRKDLGYWATVSKVIGNIYENLELLEG